MPSVFDQPTSSPWARAMWAIIREVVVLPLVPVTATTGTRGLIVVGLLPGSTAAARAAASPTTPSMSLLGSASRTSATASPSATPEPRCRQGNATTSWCGSLVDRTRTASLVVPVSRAIALTRRAVARAANRCRNPVSGAPGRAFFNPIREANLSARSSGTAARALMSIVSLIAARGK